MPSAYEPCGLSQMVALRYGSLPIAHRTGGLRDTINLPITVDDGAAATDLQISAVINQQNALSGIVKSGAGTLLLTGANSYTGTTTVNGGTLTVGAGGTLGATTASLTVNNPNTGAGNGVIVNLPTAVDTVIGSLTGTIAVPSGGVKTVTSSSVKVVRSDLAVNDR